MTVGIIGGGASGMAAALAAAQYPNTQVILLERQSRVGLPLFCMPAHAFPSGASRGRQ